MSNYTKCIFKVSLKKYNSKIRRKKNREIDDITDSHFFAEQSGRHINLKEHFTKKNLFTIQQILHISNINY